jgi:hypothetical protein
MKRDARFNTESHGLNSAIMSNNNDLSVSSPRLARMVLRLPWVSAGNPNQFPLGELP